METTIVYWGYNGLYLAGQQPGHQTRNEHQQKCGGRGREDKLCSAEYQCHHQAGTMIINSFKGSSSCAGGAFISTSMLLELDIV